MLRRYCLLLFFSVPLWAQPGLDAGRLTPLDSLMQQAVAAGQTPGAVLLVGQGEQVLYHKAFGRFSTAASAEVQPDTLYDWASLTKPFTATLILRLQELGKLSLSDAIGQYLPELTEPTVQAISIRDLLTHSSGLPASFDLQTHWTGSQGLATQLAALRLTQAPGQFVYSDIGFVLLGLIAERAGALPLAELMQQWVFAPLKMQETAYQRLCQPWCPPAEKRLKRTAPTALRSSHPAYQWLPAEVQQLQGIVHDPTAQRLAGVAGHAGLFGTAADLALWLQMLQQGLQGQSTAVLSPASAQLMVSPYWLPSKSGPQARGLGLDMHSAYSSARGELFPPGSVGHTGYTGTSFWLDPQSGTYLVLLTNRTYPDDSATIRRLRSQLATVVAAAVTGMNWQQRRQSDAWFQASRPVEPPSRRGL
ncbi:serine hydrolase domain-containing protein [Rheinheimera sp.]|uniref:serine hydrolase domain-containing protein n=1 Tax=Rheinheimera sp. TaxID=1869214 RepID=UPI00307F5041